MNNFMSLQNVGIMAALTAIVAGWTQVKGFLERIIGIFIVTVEIKGRCNLATQVYCWKLKRSWTPFVYYNGVLKFVKPLKKHSSVAYESIGEKGTLFFDGIKPIYIGMSKNYHDASNFKFIRGTFNPDKLIFDVLQSLDKYETADRRTRFKISRLSGASGKNLLGLNQKGSGGQLKDDPSNVCMSSEISSIDYGRLVSWKEDDIGELVYSHDPIGKLSLNEETENVIEEIKRWYESKDWYLERGIPWRRGVLFYGQPGTGKSSLIKAIGQSLDLPIYLFDISTMDNQEFYKNWQTALANTPAIALIEDIDAVFDKRENIVAEKGQGLTYDCLLNTISGVESSDGLLLIITTNCLEKIDQALGIPEKNKFSSRPGRIDRVVELPPLDRNGRLKMAKRILRDCDPEIIESLVDNYTNDTGAQFEDRCAQVALKLYWDRHHNVSSSASMFYAGQEVTMMGGIREC